MYEDELDRLEIRISYLEKQNEELNEVVIEQGKTITHLMVQMEEMKKKVKARFQEFLLNTLRVCYLKKMRNSQCLL